MPRIVTVIAKLYLKSSSGSRINWALPRSAVFVREARHDPANQARSQTLLNLIGMPPRCLPAFVYMLVVVWGCVQSVIHSLELPHLSHRACFLRLQLCCPREKLLDTGLLVLLQHYRLPFLHEPSQWDT
jgi:hypothetical protein